MIDIPGEEYALARKAFQRFDTGGNFLISTRTVLIIAVVSLLPRLYFQKWWLLIVPVISFFEYAKKAGLKEGCVHGFEYGFERAFHSPSGLNYPEDDD
ncbi:MAG: hypothetical protein M3Y57_05430 [Acidobacteriota bacterium]|nr:hypothetical protein [Acidobacteriota bacterium]